MRINILKYLFIILSLAGFDYFILSRYISWGLPNEQIWMYGLFLILAEILLVTSIKTYKNIINPYSVFCVFIYTTGFSFLRLAEKQDPYSSLFICILILTITCFLLGCFIGGKVKLPTVKLTPLKLSKKTSFLISMVLLIIGILVFITEIRQLGYLPLLNIGSLSVYDDLIENEVSPLHNFIVLNAILPAIFFVFYKNKVISFFVFLLVSLISVFILMNFMSRQMIILLFFTCLLTATYYYKISTLKLSIIGIIVVIIFIALGELRNNKGEDSNANSINEVIKNYTGIAKPTNLIETYHSLYGGVNFSTANKLITSAIEDKYFGGGIYFLRPIISILPIDKSSLYPLKYSSYTQLGTFIVDPYLDFRWLGVVFYNFIYGFISMTSFKNYLRRLSPYYIIEWGLLMFCIFMTSFTNFFHMFFVFFFFTINRLLLK